MALHRLVGTLSAGIPLAAKALEELGEKFPNVTAQTRPKLLEKPKHIEMRVLLRHRAGSVIEPSIHSRFLGRRRQSQGREEVATALLLFGGQIEISHHERTVRTFARRTKQQVLSPPRSRCL